LQHRLTLVNANAIFANMDNERTPSDVVAATVREVRGKQGMTVAALAERCAAAGAPQLSMQALYKLEGRRPGKLRPRPVTVDELMALACALDIAPLYLLTGLGRDSEPYQVTGNVRERTGKVRQWICGTIEGANLRGVDRLVYLTQRPHSVTARLRVTEEGDA
jgi:transcriptional regulator with XRE-family HTH domain